MKDDEVLIYMVPLYLYIYLTYYIIKVFKNCYVSRYMNEEYKTSISESFQELLDHESYICFLKCSLTQIKLQMPLLQPSIQAYWWSILVISRLKEDKLLLATSLLRVPTKGDLLWNLSWQKMRTKYKKFILGSEHTGQCQQNNSLLLLITFMCLLPLNQIELILIQSPFFIFIIN